MATVKIVLFTSKKLKDNKYPIMLRVTKDRVRKYFSLGYSAYKEDWINEDETGGRLNANTNQYKLKNKAMMKQLWKAEEIISEFEADAIDWTLSSFKDKFLGTKSVSVFEFIEQRINSLNELGNIGNAKTYETMRSALKKFSPNKYLRFNEITPAFLLKFEHFQRKRGNKDTSISVVMRTLRAAFNLAIKEKKCKQDYYPFKEYKISTLDHSTKKRAIKFEDIEKIIAFEPDPKTKQQLSKDLFLFSFYNMGMNFKDIALLKWENISKERMDYKRSKTKKEFSIKMLPPVIEILDFYQKHNPNSDFIFPVLNKSYNTPDKIHRRIKSGLRRMNLHLKQIGEQLGIEMKVTSYVSRHSWATILKRKGIPVGIISEGLGHSSESVTQVYLDSFENETLDKVNEQLLN